MSGKEIHLIREIMERLNEKPFDLQSWKTNAIMILGRIFGENSRKADLIRSIQPDFSSWSLRDATGRISQMDECKKMAREVLEASIAELEAFGLPEKSDPDTNPAIVAMEEYVTVKQSKDIIDVLKSGLTREEKLVKITGILKNLDQVDLLGIVARALVG